MGHEPATKGQDDFLRDFIACMVEPDEFQPALAVLNDMIVIFGVMREKRSGNPGFD